MRKLARLISIAFHPVALFSIMPFLVVYKTTHRPLYALAWNVYSSLFIVAGIAIIQLLVWAGILSDRDVSRREQRKWLYAILCSLAFVYMLIALFLKGHFFPLSIISAGIVAGLILFAVINHFTKLSIHAAVSAAFVFTTYYLFGASMLLITIWILPLIWWSRATLHKHTLSQIMLGYSFGIGVSLVTLLVAQFLYRGVL